MACNNGTKGSECRICGKRYQLTNFMKSGGAKRPAQRLNELPAKALDESEIARFNERQRTHPRLRAWGFHVMALPLVQR